MRDRLHPWFRTPVVTHAHAWAAFDGRCVGGEDGVCGRANGGLLGPGVPTCPDCAMSLECAIQAGVGTYDEGGRFSFDKRAFPSVERLVFGSLQMMTPAGMTSIVASEMYAPHEVILETLGPNDELKQLSIGGPGFTPARLIEEIMEELSLGNRTARVVMMPHQWAALNSDMAALRQYDVSYLRRRD